MDFQRPWRIIVVFQIITSQDETCQSIPDKGGDIAVKYNAAQIDQVTAIKARSVYCEQEIYYDCNNADLTFKDQAGWYDQSGTVKKYWGGNSGKSKYWIVSITLSSLFVLQKTWIANTVKDDDWSAENSRQFI